MSFPKICIKKQIKHTKKQNNITFVKRGWGVGGELDKPRNTKDGFEFRKILI